MRCRPLAAVVLLLLCPLTAFAGQDCKLVKYAELPVTMSGTRPLVAGTINGADALFLADSGAFSSVMGRESATRYKLQIGNLPPGAYVKGVGGAVGVQLGLARDFTLAGLGGVTFHKVAFVVLDDSASPAVSQGPGAPAAIIGQNVLGLHDAEYDLANGYIRLFKAQDCSDHMLAYWHADGPIGLLKIAHTSWRAPHLIASAVLDGKSIHVLFDTGAGRSVLTRKAAERVGFKPENPDVTVAGLSSGIGRHRIETWIARFDSLDLGGEEVKNARLRVGDIELPEDADMLLGADFFLSHRVFVANSQRQIYFTYNGGRVFDLSVTDESQANATPTAGPADSEKSPPASAADQPSGEAASVSSATGPGSPGASTASDTGAGAQVPDSAKAFTDAPTDAAGFRRRGAASAGRLQYRAAITDFDQAIRLEPNDPENYLQRAAARAHEHEFAQALGDFDAALRINPDSIPGLLGRGALRLAGGDQAGARADFDHASAIAPADTGLSLHVAEIYLQAGRFEQAIALFDRWIAAHASDSRLGSARIGRSWARAALGKELDLALKDCNATMQHGTNSFALQVRGLLWLRLGKLDKAIDDYRASLKLQPRYALARYGLGLAERGKGMRGQGDRDLQAAIADSPSVADQFKRMGLSP